MVLVYVWPGINVQTSGVHLFRLCQHLISFALAVQLHLQQTILRCKMRKPFQH